MKKVDKPNNKKKSSYGLGRVISEILLISLMVAGSYAFLIEHNYIDLPYKNKIDEEIEYVENVNIGVGEKFYVTDISNDYKWESIDTSIAKVNNGLIEGIAIGNTNVTLEDSEGNIRTIYVYVNENNIEERSGTSTDTYVISYDGNGGKSTRSNYKTTCKSGNSCSIMANPYTRSGYTFIGWTTNKSGKNDGYNWTGWSGTWNYKNGQNGISSNKLTLYAMWDSNSNSSNRYTITYNANGGSGKVADQICVYGQKCTLKSSGYTRSGYTFSGFATTSSASNPGFNWTGWKGTWKFTNGQYGIKNNRLVLYARWKKNGTTTTTTTTGEKFTIYYKANGGSGTMSSQTCIKGQKCTLYTNKFTKTGYKFIKWRTTSSTRTPGYNWTNWSGTWNFSNGQYGINNNTLILYATWEKKQAETVVTPTANQVVIKYMANGGTGTMNSQICTKGKKCTISSNKFTRSGYKFTKWRTTSSTSTPGYNWTNWTGTWKFNNGQYGIKDNTLVLYATWEKNGTSTSTGTKFSIIYSANGGSGVMPIQTCISGQSCTIKTSSFNRSGYVFQGWTTNSSGKDDGYKWTRWSGTWNYKNGQYGIKDNKLKLYAMWKKKAVTAPTSQFNSSYDVTKDTRYSSGYTHVASYSSATLSYKIVSKGGSDYALIHVSDPTKQLKNAFPTWGKVYSAEHILASEISSYGYKNKGMIAINASFFNMGSTNTPCGQYILNKGKEMHSLGTNGGGSVAGLGKDGVLNVYSFNGSNNTSVKNSILNNGVKDTWAVSGVIVGRDGSLNKSQYGGDGINRNVVCQFDANNFLIFSGHGTLGNVASKLKNENGCKYAVNYDGGGSRKLYYKTNAQASMTKRFGGSRQIPDMLYFVEQ